MVVVAQAEDMPGIVLKCIAAGKNVFAEKPLGLKSAEAKELSDKAHEAGVILIVGFMKRYAPSYLKLKEMVTSKQLGEAKSFNVEFAVDSTPFCKDEEAFLEISCYPYC